MEVSAQFAKEMARRTIKKYGLNSVPIDLDVIFEKEGYKKVEINKPDGVNGSITHIPGRGTFVAINTAKPLNRIRFTLAHELGHIFLNHDKRDVYDGEKFREMGETNNFDDQDELPSGAPEKEVEANIFASELLIPLEQLKKYAKRGYDLEKLAEIFQVSKHAMSIAYNNNWKYLK